MDPVSARQAVDDYNRQLLRNPGGDSKLEKGAPSKMPGSHSITTKNFNTLGPRLKKNYMD